MQPIFRTPNWQIQYLDEATEITALSPGEIINGETYLRISTISLIELQGCESLAQTGIYR